MTTLIWRSRDLSSSGPSSPILERLPAAAAIARFLRTPVVISLTSLYRNAQPSRGSVLSARQDRQILAGSDGRVVCSNDSGVGCATHDTQQQCIIDLSAAFKLGDQVSFVMYYYKYTPIFRSRFANRYLLTCAMQYLVSG